MRRTAAAHPLEAEGLGVRLGGRSVLHDVSLGLAQGTWTAIVGPNGAGKSTLLRTLAGLQAGAGTVWLEGRPLGAHAPHERARGLAWLAQQGEAASELNARDVVRLGRLAQHGLFGAATPDDEAAVDAAMARCECSGFGGRRIATLSGGERQRVLLARALAVGARVLLLDEPTTHLDPPHQAALVRLMRSEARRGAAVASVLHDLTLALAADRLLVMSEGRVIADGPCDDASVHAAMVDVFGRAIRIERVGTSWTALPQLEE
jgi:iron complex transport system ATP-binding protein